MKRILIICLLLITASCGSSRVITSKEENRKYDNNKPEKETVTTTQTETVNEEKEVETTVQETSPEIDHTTIASTDKVAIYIHKYKNIAQYEMQQSGIPASITLAQGILESGAGHGDLTKRANNHFGIKCHGWKGAKVYHDDDKKGECFRKYDHPSESFKDHSAFLTSRKRYASLFDLKKTDYKGWAKGLRKAGYATDPRYPQKLISLIERYHLYEYDNKAAGSVVVEEANEDEEVVSVVENENVSETYKVQKGDTLYQISKKYNITVEKLMSLNDLKDNSLSIGQELIIK